MRVCLYYFTDPYQTLGPLSSQLANPGKNLNQCKIKLGRHKWGLYTVRHKIKQGLTHLQPFRNFVNIKQHPFCYHNCSFQLPQIRLPSHPMIICPSVSSQKTKSSHHPRTEQANKLHSSSLTPALTGLWVGFCPDVSYFFQTAQWKGHI